MDSAKRTYCKMGRNILLPFRRHGEIVKREAHPFSFFDKIFVIDLL